MSQLMYFRQVDFFLQGGDLFHDNKPSRLTLVQVVEILRRHVFGDRAISFEVISDQKKNFPDTFVFAWLLVC